MKLRNKNTGEIGVINLKVYGNDAEYVYDTLETLYKEWEDYKPTEPLIKDEKIRKAVRAWVDFNHPHELFVVSVSRIVDEKNNEIKFSGQPFCSLVSMQPSITELCGKEEE